MPDQRYLVGVAGDTRAVPVPGAVDRQLRDRAIGDVGPNQLTAVSGFAVLVPQLLDLEDETRWGGIETETWNQTGTGVPGVARGDGVLHAL